MLDLEDCFAYNCYVSNNESISAIRSWWKLERARAKFDAQVKREAGVTGSQVALLRIIKERDPVSILRLREELDWHPASLGQAISRLESHDLLKVENDVVDRRRRVCVVTEQGRDLLSRVPLVGPVRLRTQQINPEDLAVMKRGFEIALSAFGLEEWSIDE